MFADLVIPKWLRWAAAALLLLVIVFVIGRCTADDGSENEQAEQTTRSGTAIADAAANAIETLDGRTATEDAIDQVVARTVSEIDTAADAEAVRNAVLIGVCQQNEHRNDPACMPSAENAR